MQVSANIDSVLASHLDRAFFNGFQTSFHLFYNPSREDRENYR